MVCLCTDSLLGYKKFCNNFRSTFKKTGIILLDTNSKGVYDTAQVLMWHHNPEIQKTRNVKVPLWALEKYVIFHVWQFTG